MPAHRSTARSLLCLALGLLTTVALAWAASLQSSAGMVAPDMTARRRSPWMGEGSGWIRAHHAIKPDWRQTFAQATDEATYAGIPGGTPGLLPTVRTPDEILTARERHLVMPWLDGSRPWPSGVIENFTLNEYGWPWRALYSRHLLAGSTDVWDHQINLTDVHYFATRPPGDPRGLPVGPVWGGLLSDAALSTLAWAILLFAMPLLRARVRWRRGRCPRCGYDLKGDHSSGCPECGSGRAVH